MFSILSFLSFFVQIGKCVEIGIPALLIILFISQVSHLVWCFLQVTLCFVCFLQKLMLEFLFMCFSFVYGFELSF